MVTYSGLFLRHSILEPAHTSIANFLLTIVKDNKDQLLQEWQDHSRHSSLTFLVKGNKPYEYSPRRHVDSLHNKSVRVCSFHSCSHRHKQENSWFRCIVYMDRYIRVTWGTSRLSRQLYRQLRFSSVSEAILYRSRIGKPYKRVIDLTGMKIEQTFEHVWNLGILFGRSTGI